MAVNDLAALDDVKAWLFAGPSAAPTTDDALLGWLISAASSFITSWLGGPWPLQAWSEQRDGTGGRVLVFAHRPVQAVSELTIDGQPVPPATDGTMPGYLFSPTVLALRGWRFSRGTGNVRIGYTAGYAIPPDDLVQACIFLVAWRYRGRDRTGLTSKGLGGETTGFSQADLPPDVLGVLQRYRSVVTP